MRLRSTQSLRRRPSAPRLPAVAFVVGLMTMTLLVALEMTAAAAPSDSLTFLSTTTLSVKFRTSTEPYVTDVLIANSGDARNDVAFNLIFVKAGKVTTSGVAVAANERTIGANATHAFTLTFAPNGTTDSLTGFLVVSASGAAPGSRPISTHLDQRVLFAIGPATLTLGTAGFPGGPGSVLSWAALIGVALVGARAGLGRYDLRKKMGKPTFKFTESFASTFTGLGAALGTALGASFLPDEPELLVKAQFLGLNVLFAMLLASGAAIYQIFQDQDGHARVAVFLIAALFTFTAVFGELLTLLLLIGEASTKFDSRTLTWSFVALSLFGAALVIVYGWRGIQAAYETGTGIRAAELQGLATETPQEWVAL